MVMPFEETSDGAAYLSSLKKPVPSSPADTATARAPDLSRPAEAPRGFAPSSFSIPPRPEKRRTPRYKCKGSARIHASDKEVSTWATFTDISLHGCYIETPAPFSVGTYIGLKLELDGLRVEVSGEVRTSFPGVGMGVFFTCMSDPDRARLSTLVKSFSQPSVAVGVSRTQSVPKPNAARAITNPHAVLQAVVTFFEGRQTMGREEFLTILRKNQ
jgi:hypothetical protein